MKKLLMSGLALVLLAGCGSDQPKEDKTVCTIEESGIKADMTLTTKDDKVQKIKMGMKMDGSSLGLGEMSEEEKNMILAAFESEMGNALPKDAEGLEIKFDIDGTDMVMSFDIDYEKIDEETLEALDVAPADLEKDLDKKALIEELEDGGWSCK